MAQEAVLPALEVTVIRVEPDAYLVNSTLTLREAGDRTRYGEVVLRTLNDHSDVAEVIFSSEYSELRVTFVPNTGLRTVCRSIKLAFSGFGHNVTVEMY